MCVSAHACQRQELFKTVMKRSTEEDEDNEDKQNMLENASFIMNEESILVHIIANSDIETVLRLYDTSKKMRLMLDQIVRVFPVLPTFILVDNVRIYNTLFVRAVDKKRLIATLRRKIKILFIDSCALHNKIPRKPSCARFRSLTHITLRVNDNTVPLCRNFFGLRFITNRDVTVYNIPTPVLDDCLMGQGRRKDLMMAKYETRARSYCTIIDHHDTLFTSNLASVLLSLPL